MILKLPYRMVNLLQAASKYAKALQVQRRFHYHEVIHNNIGWSLNLTRHKRIHEQYKLPDYCRPKGLKL